MMRKWGNLKNCFINTAGFDHTLCVNNNNNPLVSCSTITKCLAHHLLQAGRWSSMASKTTILEEMEMEPKNHDFQSCLSTIICYCIIYELRTHIGKWFGATNSYSTPTISQPKPRQPNPSVNSITTSTSQVTKTKQKHDAQPLPDLQSLSRRKSPPPHCRYIRRGGFPRSASWSSCLKWFTDSGKTWTPQPISPRFCHFTKLKPLLFVQCKSLFCGWTPRLHGSVSPPSPAESADFRMEPRRIRGQKNSPHRNTPNNKLPWNFGEVPNECG